MRDFSKLALFSSVIALTIAILCASGYAKKANTFPGVNYAYVKAYLFNIEQEEVADRPDLYLHRDGVWSVSKMGNGVVLSKHKTDQLNLILSGDTELLQRGLSKCFIPRHGFAYFDKDHRVIAHVALCFECEGIKIFPPVRASKTTRGFASGLRHAQKTLKRLEVLVRSLDLPVFDDGTRYIGYVTRNPVFESVGQTHLIDADLFKRLWSAQPTFQRIKTKKGRRGRRFSHLPLLSWPPLTLFSDGLTRGVYDDRSQLLYGVVIEDPRVFVADRLRVGIAFEDMKAMISGYNGPKNPQLIRVSSGDGYAMDLHFRWSTLKRIDVYPKDARELVHFLQSMNPRSEKTR